MTDHPSAKVGTTQCDIILASLRNKQGDWVGLPELAFTSHSMAVHSRISDLRLRGHQIEHRNQRKGRQVHSFYRLIQADQLPLF